MNPPQGHLWECNAKQTEMSRLDLDVMAAPCCFRKMCGLSLSLALFLLSGMTRWIRLHLIVLNQI